MRIRDYFKLFWELEKRKRIENKLNERLDKTLMGTTSTELQHPSMTKMQKRLDNYKNYLIYLFNKQK